MVAATVAYPIHLGKIFLDCLSLTTVFPTTEPHNGSSLLLAAPNCLASSSLPRSRDVTSSHSASTACKSAISGLSLGSISVGLTSSICVIANEETPDAGDILH